MEQLERKPITIEGIRVEPPRKGADPRQVYDFYLLGAALSPQVPDLIARQLVDAYVRLYPPYYDSSAGGSPPYTPPEW